MTARIREVTHYVKVWQNKEIKSWHKRLSSHYYELKNVASNYQSIPWMQSDVHPLPVNRTSTWLMSVVRLSRAICFDRCFWEDGRRSVLSRSVATAIAVSYVWNMANWQTRLLMVIFKWKICDNGKNSWKSTIQWQNLNFHEKLHHPHTYRRWLCSADFK
jgi:hypothetical protein